ncbi:MAG: hypothetical protein V1787_00035 [Candidatus Micrarchaeota archaeon]
MVFDVNGRNLSREEKPFWMLAESFYRHGIEDYSHDTWMHNIRTAGIMQRLARTDEIGIKGDRAWGKASVLASVFYKLPTDRLRLFTKAAKDYLVVIRQPRKAQSRGLKALQERYGSALAFAETLKEILESPAQRLLWYRTIAKLEHYNRIRDLPASASHRSHEAVAHIQQVLLADEEEKSILTWRSARALDRLQHFGDYHYSPNVQNRAANVLLDFYSRFTHERDQYALSSVAEDQSFQILHPDTYRLIKSAMNAVLSERATSGLKRFAEKNLKRAVQDAMGRRTPIHFDSYKRESGGRKSNQRQRAVLIQTRYKSPFSVFLKLFKGEEEEGEVFWEKKWDQIIKDLVPKKREWTEGQHRSEIVKELEKRIRKKVFDLMALRVVTPGKDKRPVYSVEQAFTTRMRTRGLLGNPGGRNYIRNPKSNGYQSLHKQYFFPNNTFEVQFRTEDMHTRAEYGMQQLHSLIKRGPSVLREGNREAQLVMQQYLTGLIPYERFVTEFRRAGTSRTYHFMDNRDNPVSVPQRGSYADLIVHNVSRPWIVRGVVINGRDVILGKKLGAVIRPAEGGSPPRIEFLIDVRRTLPHALRQLRKHVRLQSSRDALERIEHGESSPEEQT